MDRLFETTERIIHKWVLEEEKKQPGFQLKAYGNNEVVGFLPSTIPPGQARREPKKVPKDE